MTLSRQLLTGIAACFVAMLVGIEAIYVSSAKTYLEQQLDAHANETATSLALSLGSRIIALDPSQLEIMVSPVFDRGHFQSIEVRSAGGERVYGRELGHREMEVPQWFASLVSLEGARGEALVTAGWRQLGKVIVRVHPGYAYRQLYDTALATLALLALLLVVALVAMRYYLAGILQPLRGIEQAALAISNREFVSIDAQPRARELQRVTHAINSLSAKIREAIEQESARAERLRREAFEDPLTGHFNRRGFEQSVSALLGEGGEIYSGALALFAISGLEEVNRLFGLATGDAIVKHLAGRLAANGSEGETVVGRWQGPALAAFLPNVGRGRALAWADGICREFGEQLRAEGLPAGATLASGVAHFGLNAVELAPVAQAAERALAQAAQTGRAVLAAEEPVAMGEAADIRGEIETALTADGIVLLGQKVIALDDARVLQVEILASLAGIGGRVIAAAAFVPVANQHGLLPLLDQKVAERVMRAIGQIETLPRQVSVNVSIQSIADRHFRAALRELLARNREAAGRLVFEMTGYAASRAPELTRDFAADLRRLGAQAALDNFDLDRNAMTIVHQLMPSYIKLAPAFTRQIGEREDLRFIVEAMLRMLRPLEIPLIAQGVEDAAAIPVLAELGLAAYQGYAGGKPEPVIIA